MLSAITVNDAKVDFSTLSISPSEATQVNTNTLIILHRISACAFRRFVSPGPYVRFAISLRSAELSGAEKSSQTKTDVPGDNLDEKKNMTKGICAAIKTDPMIKTYMNIYIYATTKDNLNTSEREKNQKTRKEMFKSLYFIGYVTEKNQTFTGAIMLRPLCQYSENKKYINCILLMGHTELWEANPQTFTTNVFVPLN